jgi:cysteine-S-conjugate beta-lyase
MAAPSLIDPVQAFDVATEERARSMPCGKWSRFEPDVLPLWVADMDFPVADVVRCALREQIDCGSLGYPPRNGLPDLVPAVVDRLAARFGWRVPFEAIRPTPGIIPALFAGVEATTTPSDEVIVQPPAYPPFFSVIEEAGRRLLVDQLVDDGAGFRMDVDALRAAITPATRTLLFCNPHNPSGRVFTPAELERLAEVVLEHRLWVLSDELHADLVFDGQHVPFASLDPELARRTVTLYGPTKAFNLAGLKIGFMISENPALLAHVCGRVGHRMPGVNVLAQAATIAAYRRGDAWLEAALHYLRANRDEVQRRLRAEAPEVRAHTPEGTYLSWLDLRGAGLGDDPCAALLERGRLALNPGPDYGAGGDGFARLNFATSRATLDDALDRLVATVRGER